jgi:hypothetical protein
VTNHYGRPLNTWSPTSQSQQTLFRQLQQHAPHRRSLMFKRRGSRGGLTGKHKASTYSLPNCTSTSFRQAGRDGDNLGSLSTPSQQDVCLSGLSTQQVTHTHTQTKGQTVPVRNRRQRANMHQIINARDTHAHARGTGIQNICTATTEHAQTAQKHRVLKDGASTRTARMQT